MSTLDEHVHRDEAVLAHDVPARDRPREAPPQKKKARPKAAKLWAAIAEANATELARCELRAPADIPPAEAHRFDRRRVGSNAAIRAIVERLRVEPEGQRPLDALAESLRFLLVGRAAKERMGSKIADWWLGTAGPVLALDALGALGRWRLERDEFVLHDAATTRTATSDRPRHALIERLRTAVADADETTYATLLERARALRTATDVGGRAEIAYLFPGAGFAEADVADLIAARRPLGGSEAVGLLASIDDPALATRLLLEVEYHGRLEAPTLTAVARLGLAAEDAIWALHAREVDGEHAILSVPEVERALSRLATPRTAKLAADILLAKDERQAAGLFRWGVRADRRAHWSAYLARWPALVAPHLRAALADPARAATAQALLDQLAAVRGEATVHDDAPPALRAALPAGWTAPGAFRPSAPPLVLRASGRALDARERMVLVELAQRATDVAAPALAEVLDALEPGSLAAFVHDLAVARRSGDRDDRSPHDWVLRLAPRAPSRALAKLLADSASFEASATGGFAEATRLVQVLRTTATDDALERLQHLAREAGSQGLRRAASDALDAVAARRGIARTELEDALAPTFGLGPDGRTTLSAAGRTLTIAIDAHLVPTLLDEDGAPIATPPKGEIAIRFRALADELEEAMRTQAARLERAMVSEQRWTLDAFRRLIAQPVLGLVAQRVLWASFGPRVVPFRLDESRQPVGLDDAPLALETAAIGVPHPVVLPDRERIAALLADYRIVQPFPQVARPVHADPAPIVERATGKTVVSARVRELLRRGFVRGSVDSAVMLDVERRDRGVRTLLELDPGISVVDGKPAKVKLKPRVDVAADASPIAVSEAGYEIERLIG